MLDGIEKREILFQARCLFRRYSANPLISMKNDLNWWKALILLVVFGLIGYVIYWKLTHVVEEPEPEPGEQIQVVAAPLKTDEPKIGDFDTVFMACQSRPEITDRGNGYGIAFIDSDFKRELVREAILIAARDEIGALTRDELLGETAPQNPRTLALKYEYALPRGSKDHFVKIKRIEDDGQETALRDYPLSLMVQNAVEYPGLITKIEEHSRQQFVAFLKNSGVKAFTPPPSPPVAATEAALDPESETASQVDPLTEIDNLLDIATLCAQYDAVRRTHRLIRENGETLSLLRRLVRGYSQLYLLTEHQLLKTRLVFQVRAILYAQRAAAKYGYTPDNIELQGAALGATTLFPQARWRYKDAREDREKAGPQTIPPADAETDPGYLKWIRIHKAYSDYDVETMEKLSQETPSEPWANVVLFLMYEYANDPQEAVRIGRRLVSETPCTRIFDGITFLDGSIPVQGPGKVEYLEYYAKTLPQQIGSIAEIPPEVLKIAKKRPSTGSGGLFGLFGGKRTPAETVYDHRRKIIDALVATTDDPNELSWEVLARLIREETAVQVLHAARNEMRQFRNSDELLEQAAPMLEGHPFEKAILCTTHDTSDAPTETRENFLKSNVYELADIASARIGNYRILFRETNPKNLPKPDDVAAMQVDSQCFRDGFFLLYRHNELRQPLPGFVDQKKLRETLDWVAPNSPLNIHEKLADWEYDDEQVQDWIRRMNRFPSILRRVCGMISILDLPVFVSKRERLLTAIYQRTGRYDDLLALARLYSENKRKSEAVELLKGYCEEPGTDPMFQYSQYQAAELIVRQLMNEKRFKDAYQYVQKSAPSGFEMGSPVLAECFEAGGNFTRAEEAWRKQPKLYTLDIDRALFCERVGSKDWEQAAKTVSNDYKKLPFKSPMMLRPFADFYSVCNIEPPDGFPSSEEMPVPQEDYAAHWILLLDAMEKGDEAETESEFRILLREHDRLAPKKSKTMYVTFYAHSLTNLLRLDWNRERKGRIDESAIHYVLQLADNCWFDEDSVTLACFVLARYFQIVGENDKAIFYARQSLAATNKISTPHRNRAIHLLKKLQGDFTVEDYAKLVKTEKVELGPPVRMNSYADYLCLMVLQDYTRDSAAILKTETHRDPPPGEIRTFEIPETYWCVKRLRFRDRQWEEKEIPLRFYFDRGAVQFRGIGKNLDFWAFSANRKGEVCSIKLYNSISDTAFRGLVLYEDENKPMKICLNLTENGNYPDAIDDTPDESNFVVFELERMNFDLK